jgi:hypothetical protein
VREEYKVVATLLSKYVQMIDRFGKTPDLSNN